MRITIHPIKIGASLKGEYDAPPSKSLTQRAFAAALLRNGRTTIHNYGHSEDDKAALDIIKKLGVEIVTTTPKTITLTSAGLFGNRIESKDIEMGESGLSSRMFIPIIALLGRDFSIHGKGSLSARPMQFFEEILPQLGVQIQSKNGKLPIKLKGKLVPKNITIDGSISSQFLTGLLYAYVASEVENVAICVNNLTSKPYIDLTLQVLEDFGFSAPKNDNYEKFHFYKNAPKTFPHLDYTVEGDWSSASFFLVAGAIAGHLTIQGLNVFSAQADKAILQALMECGCRLSVTDKYVEVHTGERLRAFQFDAKDCPDLFPPLVALAAHCEGTSVISGISRLVHKESNRAKSLQESFSKMGVEIILQDDLMIIRRLEKIKGGTLHSHNDHRIAMALTIAGLNADSELCIEEAECVAKSYPDFFNDLQKLGAKIIEHE